MPGAKVIEVIASSEKGVDVAIQNVIAEIARTIHNNDSAFSKDVKVDMIHSQVSASAVICKISLLVDED